MMKMNTFHWGIIGICVSVGANNGSITPPLVVHNNQASVVHIYLGAGAQINHHATSLTSASAVTEQQQLAAEMKKTAHGWWHRLKCYVQGMKPAWEINLSYTDSTWWRYIRQHSFSIGWKTALVVYCMLNYRLFILRSYLRNPVRWLSGKKGVPLYYNVHDDTHRIVQDLIMTMRIREGIVESMKSDAEIIHMIMQETEAELRALETYASYAENIRWISDIQQHAALLCEGYIPPLGGIPWGNMLRVIVQKMTLGALVYVDRQLVDDSSEFRHRLCCIRELLQSMNKKTA